MIMNILLIGVQIEDLRNKNLMFGHPMAIRAVEKKTTTTWWETCEDEHQELQVIRVLSLTCNFFWMQV